MTNNESPSLGLPDEQQINAMTQPQVEAELDEVAKDSEFLESLKQSDPEAYAMANDGLEQQLGLLATRESTLTTDAEVSDTEARQAKLAEIRRDLAEPQRVTFDVNGIRSTLSEVRAENQAIASGAVDKPSRY